MLAALEADSGLQAQGAGGGADAFWLLDLDGRFLDVSQTYCDLIGYSRDELRSRRIADVEADEDAAEVARHVDRVRTRGWDRFRTHHRRKDGRVVALEVSTSLFGEGKLLVFLRDLTGRAAAEARQRADDWRRECLERVVTPAAATLRELLDRALEESLRVTGSALGYIFLYDEARRQLTLHAWSQAVMSACSVAEPQRVVDLDGTGLWGEAIRQRRPIVVNDFAAPDPHKKGLPQGHAPLRRFLTVPVVQDGRIVAVAGAANKEAPYDDEDVRQLGLFMEAVWAMAGRELADEVRSKLSAVVEQSPAAVVIFDSGGSVDYVNARLCDLVGAPREQLQGRPADRLLEGLVGREAVRELWGELLAGHPWQGEHAWTAPGGEARWLATTVAPIRNPRGAITHFAAIAEDATGRRRLDEARRQAQRMDSLGTLASGVAHDFNDILTGVVGLVTTAREELGSTHPVREDLDEVLQLTERASALTRSIQAFGRLQTAALKPEELHEVVEGALGQLRRLLGEKVRLLVTPSAERLPVLVDRGQLEHVLLHLASNARDAMPGGGDLSLTFGTVEVDAPTGGRHKVAPGRYAVLSVRDLGSGMDAATRARVFDPFFTTKGGGKGSGLGLSMVYGIVRQCRGFVTVWSEPGQGSRFDVHLPLQSAAEVGAPPPPEEAPRRGRGESVLLAEDDPTVRTVWTSLLRRHGYRVTAVEDGAAAVAAVRDANEPFDLALLDVTMPRMSGVEAYESIRRLDPRVRVLFATSYAGERVGLGLAAARERVLEKPMAPAVLLREIRAALDRSLGPPA